MTNPENAIGTNGAYGGRTSVNAFNDVLSAFRGSEYGMGILNGWEAVPEDGMSIRLGGMNKVRDVAIAEDPSGNLTTINNISGAPILVSLPNPPITGMRYDMIVAYVASPPEGSSAVVDNPQACGIIVVDGGETGMSGSGVDELIRQAITQDGAAGTTAYYVVLCEVLRQSGQVVISPGSIFPGRGANVGKKFPLTPANVDWESMQPFWETMIITDVESAGFTKTVTTTAGNQYTVQLVNGGAGACISALGDKVIAMEQITSAVFSPSVTSPNLGVQGVASGSTIYSRVLGGISNGSVMTVRETSGTGSSANWGPLATLGGTATSTVLKATSVRTGRAGTTWKIFYNSTCAGTNSSVMGDAEVPASSADVVPGIYTQNTGGKVGSATTILRVLRMP